MKQLLTLLLIALTITWLASRRTPVEPTCSYCGQWHTSQPGPPATLQFNDTPPSVTCSDGSASAVVSGDTLTWMPSCAELWRLVQHGNKLTGYYAHGLQGNTGAGAMAVEYTR